MKLTDPTEDYWIELAQQIATKAHAGETRHGGEPYITHPEAVANLVDKRRQPIAWLHDVPENTKITLEDLRQEGFPSYVIHAIDALTHRKNESNLVYWQRIAGNPDAVPVKLADIKHNLSSKPSEYAKQKYAKALDFFKKSGHSG